ncbi:MAG: peptidyl-prolyl cis-trans isomerase [Proteobacteria bacterium]|nr:peptidyl-prolyl cis-trans isomerase [Pseudomonadota bacterium]
MERAPNAVGWLTAGSLLGLAIAAGSLLADRQGDAVPADAVATVNGVPIARADYERVLAALAADRREPLGDAERERARDRLIEEELLVQQALQLGLARVDRRVRADLVQAMIESVKTDAAATPVDEKALREFYAAERDFFTVSGRLHVRQVFFRRPRSGEEAAVMARAQEARTRLRAGESFPAVRDSLGDAEVAPIPDALLPPQKLREYIGPTALRAALALEPGEVGDPVRSGSGLHVLWLVEREAAQVPGFEAIRAQVKAEWARRADDRALREYLEALRAGADVALAPTDPARDE